MAKYKVILPNRLKPFPARYELTAAKLIANRFKTYVEFVARSNLKTPDFIIKGTT